MRSRICLLLVAGLALAGCGGGTKLITTAVPVETGVQSKTSQAAQKLGLPALATKNTTRVAGSDPVADAAGVALAVYPSSAQGTHPGSVVIAPTDDWQAALSASVLMSRPVMAPLLLSGSGSLPSASADALKLLAPTGSGSVAGAQVIRVGDVPKLSGVHAATISGHDPWTLAGAIDRFSTAARGSPTTSVVIAPGTNPEYAMPAAGWAAESGDPILYVDGSTIPTPTKQALLAHKKPHIYVLGPSSVIPDGVVKQLGKYGSVKRISAGDPISSAITFAAYRDPACVRLQPCAHVPGSFGWAMRSPGHGYTVINLHRTLDAAAAAALSASGSFGPELLIDNPSTLPNAMLNFFLNYATPGYTAQGPTAAVYNHGWVIGDQTAVSVPVQAQIDNLLEAIPQQ